VFVRFQLGIVMCLLAGCVVQPTSPGPSSRGTAAPRVATGPGPLSLVPRIGIEHLPPDESAAVDSAPRVEAQPSNRARPSPRGGGEPRPAYRDPAARHAWSLSAEDLAAIDDPVARETMQFVQDLVEADQRRVRREVALPFLALEAPDLDRGPLLHSEQDLLAAQEEWAQTHGPTLLRRPMQQFLRRLPFVRNVEIEIEDFRSDHVPLTEPYRQVHGDRRSLGRLSLRVHAGDTSDPVEVAYVRSGVRIGTSQDTGKLSIDWDLSATLRLEVRARTDYRTNENGLRVDLSYRPNDGTSVHCAIGDDMDFLSTSSIYSLFETPMDGSAGLVLYAVHVF
jgi:hypothetical protein